MIFKACALEVLGRAGLPIARADLVEWLADREAEDWQPAALQPELQEFTAERMLGLGKILRAHIGRAIREAAVSGQLTAEQRELDLTILAQILGVIFEARALKVLHYAAIFDDLLADWEAKEQHVAILAPVIQEAGAIAQVMVGFGKK